MTPFFITGAPKSATGWWQVYMSTFKSFCIFEPTMQFHGNTEMHVLMERRAGEKRIYESC
jgi:hypothetical protein